MNIGMILDNEFTGDLRVENEVIALQNAGYNVFVLCLNFGKKREIEHFNGAKIVRKRLNRTIKKKLRGLNNTIFNFYPYLWSHYIKDFVKDFNINILHVHDLWMLESAYKANTKYNLPIIADLHENYVDALQGYKYIQNFPGNIIVSIERWRKKEKEWTNKADKIITVIEEAVSRYISLGNEKEKIVVVPNYVNNELFHKESQDTTIDKKYSEFFTITYVGGFDLHRGLESVIDAMPILVKTIPNVKLVLVGDGSNKNNLKKIVDKYQIEKNVDFIGWQSTNVIPDYISASEITIIPHLKSIQTDNTIPHKLFQYMALGKPVIATNCNPIVRILNDTGAGVIYESGNSKQFSQLVINFFNNSGLRKKMGENGVRAVKQKYNWNVAKKNLLDVYNSLDNRIKNAKR